MIINYVSAVESNYISFKVVDLDTTRDYENKTSADYLELTALLEEIVMNITGDILSVQLVDVRLDLCYQFLSHIYNVEHNSVSMSLSVVFFGILSIHRNLASVFF